MNIPTVDSVDHAPDDLDKQTPLRGRLLRTIAKHDRSDRFRTASVLLARRAQRSAVLDQGRRDANDPSPRAGGALGRDVNRARCEIAVGIAYVVDDSLLSSESFDLTQAEYVAIGMAKVSGPPFWSKVWSRLFRRQASRASL